METEVADVNRALTSVSRLAEAGNEVVVGPKESFIRNVKSGTKTHNEREGGAYRVKLWVPSFTRQGSSNP